MHRIPSAFVRMLCKLGKRNLVVIKTAGAYDLDMLSACNCASEIHAGYVGYENMGLALKYRSAVEEGRTKAMEHACYSVIAGLRAAAAGVPFMPINGFQGSDVPKARGFKYLPNPYGEGEVLVVPAIKPDWAVIHVQQCDAQGNAAIFGAAFEDILMSRAADKVIITTEKLVNCLPPEKVSIPHFMVHAIVHAQNGSFPCSCPGEYDADYKLLAALRGANQNDIEIHIAGGDINAK